MLEIVGNVVSVNHYIMVTGVVLNFFLYRLVHFHFNEDVFFFCLYDLFLMIV